MSVYLLQLLNNFSVSLFLHSSCQKDPFHDPVSSLRMKFLPSMFSLEILIHSGIRCHSKTGRSSSVRSAHWSAEDRRRSDGLRCSCVFSDDVHSVRLFISSTSCCFGPEGRSEWSVFWSNVDNSSAWSRPVRERERWWWWCWRWLRVAVMKLSFFLMKVCRHESSGAVESVVCLHWLVWRHSQRRRLDETSWSCFVKRRRFVQCLRRSLSWSSQMFVPVEHWCD